MTENDGIVLLPISEHNSTQESIRETSVPETDTSCSYTSAKSPSPETTTNEGRDGFVGESDLSEQVKTTETSQTNGFADQDISFEHDKSTEHNQANGLKTTEESVKDVGGGLSELEIFLKQINKSVPKVDSLQKGNYDLKIDVTVEDQKVISKPIIVESNIDKKVPTNNFNSGNISDLAIVEPPPITIKTEEKRSHVIYTGMPKLSSLIHETAIPRHNSPNPRPVIASPFSIIHVPKRKNIPPTAVPHKNGFFTPGYRSQGLAKFAAGKPFAGEPELICLESSSDDDGPLKRNDHFPPTTTKRANLEGTINRVNLLNGHSSTRLSPSGYQSDIYSRSGLPINKLPSLPLSSLTSPVQEGTSSQTTTPTTSPNGGDESRNVVVITEANKHIYNKDNVPHVMRQAMDLLATNSPVVYTNHERNRKDAIAKKVAAFEMTSPQHAPSRYELLMGRPSSSSVTCRLGTNRSKFVDPRSYKIDEPSGNGDRSIQGGGPKSGPGKSATVGIWGCQQTGCWFFASSKEEFDEHNETHDENGAHCCRKCSLTFSNEPNLKRHILIFCEQQNTTRKEKKSIMEDDPNILDRIALQNSKLQEFKDVEEIKAKSNGHQSARVSMKHVSMPKDMLANEMAAYRQKTLTSILGVPEKRSRPTQDNVSPAQVAKKPRLSNESCTVTSNSSLPKIRNHGFSNHLTTTKQQPTPPPKPTPPIFERYDSPDDNELLAKFIRQESHFKAFPPKTTAKLNCPESTCNFSDPGVEELQKHIADYHRGDKLHKCPFCDLKFATSKLSKKHELVYCTSNVNDPTLTSRLNGTKIIDSKSTESPPTLVKVHTESNLLIFKCPKKCLYTTRDHNALRAHISKDHSGTNFLCSLCMESFGAFKALAIHRRLFCPAIEEKHANHHLMDKRLLGLVKCHAVDCSFVAKDAMGYGAHMRAHTLGFVTKLRCKDCLAYFMAKEGYDEHCNGHCKVAAAKMKKHQSLL